MLKKKVNGRWAIGIVFGGDGGCDGDNGNGGGEDEHHYLSR